MSGLASRLRTHAAAVVKRIDEVSRTRELTERESRVLEHFIGIADGTLPSTTRSPHQTNIILARMGIRRDVGVYRK